MASWSKRAQAWNWPIELVGGAFALWFRFCLTTSRFEIDISDAAERAIGEGPVIFVLWHSRMILGPLLIAPVGGEVVAVRDTSPAGRIGGVLMRRAGMFPIGVRKGEGMAATRAVLKAARAGKSLGLAADGPKGPARVLGPAPLEWGGISGLPIVLFAWSTRRHRRASSWDRIMVPRPFAKGVARFDLFEETVPRKQSPEAKAAQAERLAQRLTAHTDAVDEAAGVTPGDGLS
ncbi:MAG: DUF374 domain-containing protein [Pseudomonadota bacterium]